MILCKMENKVVKYVEKGFSCSDLSTIDPLYWLCYEGQTSGHGVRNGFGTQFFSNGEKFVGLFSSDQACGQGTYYGLSKRTMGCWECNLLK